MNLWTFQVRPSQMASTSENSPDSRRLLVGRVVSNVVTQGDSGADANGHLPEVVAAELSRHFDLQWKTAMHDFQS